VKSLLAVVDTPSGARNMHVHIDLPIISDVGLSRLIFGRFDGLAD
jgi:hypothetical protein